MTDNTDDTYEVLNQFDTVAIEVPNGMVLDPITREIRPPFKSSPVSWDYLLRDEK